MSGWDVMAAVSADGRSPVRATRARIDLDALCDNTALLARVAAPAQICAVVKADAYGHGAIPVARALEESGLCQAFAVSLVEEGVELRDAGVRLPILVMGPSLAGGYAEVAARDLTAVVTVGEDLDAFAAIGRARRFPVSIHIEVDTGMARLGIEASQLGSTVAAAVHAGGVTIDGICTHFASADLPDLATSSTITMDQLARFDRALADARAAGAQPRWIHAAASAAVLRFPAAAFDMVRPGIALYGNGLQPAPALGRLRQVMTLETEIAQIRHVAIGQAVSYGGLWCAPRPSRIAVLPVGYGDGYSRRLTGSADVLVRGKRCPVVGAICMDVTLVDVTSLGHDAEVGDEVVLLGSQGDERISTAELARHAGTTEYEVSCGISRRVPRRTAATTRTTSR